MGAFMVIAAIADGHPVPGRGQRRMFFLIGTLLLVGAFALMIALRATWRRERIFAYLDPWNEKYALGQGATSSRTR
jgi:cell division protein FtsW